MISFYLILLKFLKISPISRVLSLLEECSVSGCVSLHMHKHFCFEQIKTVSHVLMQSWCEGNSSVRFQEGVEFGEQKGWGFVAGLAARVLVTGSNCLLSPDRLGRDSGWKDGIACAGTD